MKCDISHRCRRLTIMPRDNDLDVALIAVYLWPDTRRGHCMSNFEEIPKRREERKKEREKEREREIRTDRQGDQAGRTRCIQINSRKT